MMVALLERFVLCMHYSEHRPIFIQPAHNRLFSGLVTVVMRMDASERARCGLTGLGWCGALCRCWLRSLAFRRECTISTMWLCIMW